MKHEGHHRFEKDLQVKRGQLHPAESFKVYLRMTQILYYHLLYTHAS